jgi:hypothetical protein
MRNQEPPKRLDEGSGTLAEQLNREADRLRQLAQELKAREASNAEMVENYPHFERAIYAMLRERLEKELPPLPDKDLESIAAEEDAQPLEAFIGDLDSAQQTPQSHAG